jgi:AcrR family transcriptional regulator
MPRPRAHDTKRRILDSACELFARKGLGGTSVREIAAAANVNAALVSHHFGGKDKLYAACVEAMHDEIDGMREQLMGQLTSSDALAEVIRDTVARGFRYSRAHRGAVRLVMRQVLDTGELPAKRREMLLSFLDAASVVLSARTARSPSDVRLVIQSLLYLMSRYALSTVDELRGVVGMAASDPDELVLSAVASHLGNQAQWLLGLS